MRVGILTLHQLNNFGSVIQAWATIKLLTEMNCEAEIINFQLPNPGIRFDLRVKKYKNLQGAFKLRHVLWSVRGVACYIFTQKNIFYLGCTIASDHII